MIFLIFIITLVRGLVFDYTLGAQESVCFQDILPKNTFVVGDITGYPLSYVEYIINNAFKVFVLVTDPNRMLVTRSNTSEPIF